MIHTRQIESELAEIPAGWFVVPLGRSDRVCRIGGEELQKKTVLVLVGIKIGGLVASEVDKCKGRPLGPLTILNCT